MGIFSGIGIKKKELESKSIIEMYETLDRSATHLELRPTQKAILEDLEKNKNNKDIILKLSTGSGKTIIGLVYAEKARRENPGELVAYLCPNNQLADQVYREAEKIGVPVIRFHEDAEAATALGENRILITTYDKLFTGYNKFEKLGIQLSAIILDDVHAGIDRVKDKYTVKITGDVKSRILDLLEPICKKSSPVDWNEIVKNVPTARGEVPFWIWSDVHHEIREIINSNNIGNEKFSWVNIEANLKHCRCCVSASTIEISLPIPNIEDNAAYFRAKHRLFMSASIKDGVSLIRDLGCDSDALTRVISSGSDTGGGERMIIATHLLDPQIQKTTIAEICNELKEKTNVVVLTSSAPNGEFWKEHGAELVLGDEVDIAVNKLKKTTKGNFVVFAQRFEGIDLADHACRLLIIDGIPTGERISDSIDLERQSIAGITNMKALNKFEQALGRSVRSNADYSAVLLFGIDIATFIGKKNTQQLLEPHIKEQINIGKKIVNNLKSTGMESKTALTLAIEGVISRDTEWRDEYRTSMGAVIHNIDQNYIDTEEEIAKAEREAWILARRNNLTGAALKIQDIIDRKSNEIDCAKRSELLVKIATYLSSSDLVKAHQIYQRAFSDNPKIPSPIELIDKKYSKTNSQANSIATNAGSFSELNACLSKIEQIKNKLSFGNDYQTVEDGLYELGLYLGAESSRPEKETNRGPDVLWHFDDFAFCIEAKSEKTSKIFKQDAGQLLLSQEWCREKLSHIPEKNIIPVFATNTIKYDRKEDISFQPKFLTERIALDISEILAKVYSSIQYDGPLFADESRIHSAINANKLTPSDIAKKFEAIK